MKVLFPGRQQRGWSVKTYCTGSGNGGGGCGALLLVEQADLYITRTTDISGSSDTFVTFKCSACDVETDLGGVPSTIIRKLPHKSDRIQTDWR